VRTWSRVGTVPQPSVPSLGAGGNPKRGNRTRSRASPDTSYLYVHLAGRVLLSRFSLNALI